jgi:hypothetical protein
MHRVSDENRHKRRDTKNMDIDTAKIRFKNYLESSGYAASTIECEAGKAVVRLAAGYSPAPA